MRFFFGGGGAGLGTVGWPRVLGLIPRSGAGDAGSRASSQVVTLVVRWM